MKLNIRSKLILAISTLLVVLFLIAAYSFISEKRRELADDIYSNTLSFARLTAGDIANFYDLYLAQNSFVYFNREVQGLLEQNDDVGSLAVLSYDGEILYDSRLDKNRRYEGAQRLASDLLLQQIQSENISVLTAESQLVYLRLDEDGQSYDFVDRVEKPIEVLESGTLLDYLVVPANERYAVVYYLNYENLQQRLDFVMTRIIYLALFGISLGMILSFMMAERVSKPVGKLVKGAEEVAKGNFDTQVDIQTGDEIAYLGSAFNRMTKELKESIENKLYKERVMHELDLAREIQQQVLPDTIPKVTGLKISAGIIPASEIGGDIYDFIQLTDNRLLMYIGDVTGHGVPAGIVGSIANALFYGYALVGDLKKILVDVNKIMKAKTMKTMFMTLCLMHWDAVKGKFLYANSGHEKLIHYKRASDEVELKDSGGIALGMMEDISEHTVVKQIDLHPGDVLIAYSDGFPEAKNKDGEHYGIDRLMRSVRMNAKLDAVDAIKNAVFADAKQFTVGAEQMDDMTLIVMKRV